MPHSPPVRYDAILPAGGRIDPDFAARVGTDVKALIQFEGQTILARTLEALRGTGIVGRTVVIGPEEVQAHAVSCGADHALDEATTGPDNIFRGLDCLLQSERRPEHVLLVTTDLPFLTPDLIHRFVQSCPADTDFCVPLIRKTEYDARFPGSSATFVRLKDDAWTTGCAYIINVDALLRARMHIDRVFANRKSKAGMARLLGPSFVFKWLTGRLTLRDVEAKIKSLLDSTGAAVTGSPPELAYDIDYLDDYEYAVEHLSKP
jgi:molybdopterin-guanine dinucleotide biosynthesis protein A